MAELNSLGHSVNILDRVHDVLRQMMLLRGYGKLVHAIRPPNAEPVIIAHRTTAPTCTAREKEIYIFITTDSKLGIEQIRRYHKVAVHSKISHIIIIHGNGGATPPTNAQIAVLQSNGLYIETFKMSALSFYPVMTTYTVLGEFANPDTDDNNSLQQTEHVTEKPSVDKCKKMPWNDIQRRFHDWPVGTVVQRPRQRGNLCEDYCIRIVMAPE